MGLPMAGSRDDEPHRKGLLELHACLAATGQHLSLVALPVASSVADLNHAVLQERRDEERGTCAFHLVLGGRFQEASVPLLSLGLRSGSVVDLVRCRSASVITASSDGTAKVFSMETGVCTLTLPGHSRDASPGAFSPDGARVAVFTRPGLVARIQKVATGHCLLSLSGHVGPLNAVTFSPEGYHVATASADRTARIWNARTGECVRTLVGHKGEVLDVAFASDGRLVLTASEDASAKIWSVAAGACTCTLVGHKWAVNSARFSPDARCIVTTSDDRTAKLWNAETGECSQTFEGHQSPVVEASFSACWNPEASRKDSSDNTSLSG